MATTVGMSHNPGLRTAEPGEAMDADTGPEDMRHAGEPASDRDIAAAAGVPVVGIGASAGGLEAFKLLLGSLPADTGFAIVLIQHLDPTHQSSLSEILRRATTMPVTDAADGVLVERNHVYVIPPNTVLTISNRVLKLSPRGQMPGLHMPIDRFFQSLAHDCRSQAVGIVLSGAGSDGSLGMQAIAEAGGITFAQESGSAKFPSMPQTAQAASQLDFVLPPAQIAAELARIARNPHFAIARPDESGSLLDREGMLGEIFKLMHASTGVDFSLYREKTMERRILRRMALRNIAGIEEYASQLRQDPGERSLLQTDLLITVTSFFRDPGSFDSLNQHVFPAILQNRPAGAAIRIWVPGCATGEEVYSIAISLQEYLSSAGAVFPVQIFATDISEAAIGKARSGKYLENIASTVSPERLNSYFKKIETGYQVSKPLREMCVFSRHNLIADPPFAKLDLISCRNVLIYLGGVRKNVISGFHYALRQGGFLMLGTSETPNSDEMFQQIDRDHRIYAKRALARRPMLLARAGLVKRSAERDQMAERTPTVQRPEEMGKAVDRLLLTKFSPTAVLVNEALEVIETRGDVTRFFKLPLSKLSLHLLNLLPDTGLFLEIEKLVHEAVASGETARRAQVPYESDNSIREVNIAVTPIYNGDPSRVLLVVLEPAQTLEDFTGEGQAKPVEHRDAIALRDGQIAKLRLESGEARRRLLAVIEEQQLADEESQSAAEEGLSANEELQSLNEELETAKEELQSTNEELITINQELESKNVALTVASNFANSIVETVRIPLLVLDKDLRIRTVNQSFARTFGTPARDVEGQLLYQLAGGAWDIPELRDVMERVLPTRKSFESFEVEREFPSVGFRALVLNGCVLERLNLILIAIDDVTMHKEAEKALRVVEDALRQAQKMEAIGRLAGGIAHDFNNLLTAIIGYSRLVMDSLTEGHEAIDYMHEIESAGQRAATLTDQLLAFSRRKVLQPKVFDVNLVIGDFVRMLRRTLGESIKVEVRLAAEVWRVRADPGEIGRALINLCLNGRDAMPLGGTLTIETSNVTTSEAEARLHNLRGGQYVEMVVRDTGIGMDAETQTRIFEPFFTTKETGKGTGLGLAMVLGIVEQSGGAIWCTSELGQGTRFKVLLPGVAAEADLAEPAIGRLAEAPKGSAEVVLLVEDEAQVRNLASKILKGRGYVVLEARDGREGLSVSEAHQGKIDLLVSDVVMAELGGREMADRILMMRPDIKVLFMSGHTEDVILKEGVKAGTAFLQKPFSPSQLAYKVREVLDAQGRSQRSQEA
jgi:two-component system, chemotaxis family, CheB/CheR fusion protein